MTPVLGVGTLERPSPRPLPAQSFPAWHGKPKKAAEAPLPPAPKASPNVDKCSPSDSLYSSHPLQSAQRSWCRSPAPLRTGGDEGRSGEGGETASAIRRAHRLAPSRGAHSPQTTRTLAFKAGGEQTGRGRWGALLSSESPGAEVSRDEHAASAPILVSGFPRLRNVSCPARGTSRGKELLTT